MKGRRPERRVLAVHTGYFVAPVVADIGVVKRKRKRGWQWKGRVDP